MDDIRIGVIGCAGRGGMARQWHKPGKGSVLVGGCDVSDEALATFRGHVGDDVFTTHDSDKLLAREDVDAVAVMSPDWTHENYVCDAFAAGKHVFTEKPMAITTKGCDRMLRAWVESGKHFMIGFNMRYMNFCRVMKDAVDSGVIGELKVVWVRHFVAAGGGWYFHDWHGNSKTSTGLLLQKASHDIDIVHWICGQYTAKVAASGGLDYYGGDKPNDLRCRDCADKDTCVEYQYFPDRPGNKMDMCVYRQEVDVEDNSVMMMQMDGGIRATYMQCHFAPETWRNYTFIGTEGRIENTQDGVIVRTRNRSNRWANLSHWKMDVKAASGGHGGADPVITEDFLRMIRTGQRPLATPLAGRMSVAAGCAATDSIRNGWQVVDVPPVPEDIRDRVF